MEVFGIHPNLSPTIMEVEKYQFFRLDIFKEGGSWNHFHDSWCLPVGSCLPLYWKLLATGGAECY